MTSTIRKSKPIIKVSYTIYFSWRYLNSRVHNSIQHNSDISRMTWERALSLKTEADYCWNLQQASAKRGMTRMDLMDLMDERARKGIEDLVGTDEATFVERPRLARVIEMEIDEL